MLCNLDRVITGERKIVECKSSSGFMRPTWGATGSDEAPMIYLLQVQHQMSVSGYEDSDIAALIDIDDYRIYRQPRNEKVIATIESACEKFWHEHVLADVPPPPTTRGDLKLMHPFNNGNFIEATQEIIEHIAFYQAAHDDMKAMEDKKSEHAFEITKFIAKNDGIKLGDKVLATYQANKAGTRSLSIKKGV